MRAALFGKYLKGQLKNLTPHQRLAAQWWLNRGDEIFPPDEWIEQSEEHINASFLIADIKSAAYNGREVNFEAYK